jgi:hypothetical protein
MNGRVYDPVIARFLSPDPYVQSPDYSQNFNRYSYALNNPLKFTDPSGEWIHILMGAIIGGVINWATNGFQFNAAGLGYFAVGAVAGALGAGIGAGVGGLVSGAGHFSFGVASSLSVGGMGALGGAAIGAGVGLVSGFVTGFGNALVGQENIGNALKLGVTSAAWGAAIGGVTGAIGGAIRAHKEGVNIWKGYLKHMAVADPARPAFPTKVGSSNRTNLRSLPQDPEAERKLLASADIPFSEQAQGSMNCLIENQYAINQSQGGTLSKTDIKGWYPKDDKILDVHGWDIYSNKTGATVHGYAANKNILEKIPIAMKNGSSVNLTIGNSMDAHSVTIRNVLSETVGSGTEYIYQVMDPLKVNGSREVLSNEIINVFFIKH